MAECKSEEMAADWLIVVATAGKRLFGTYIPLPHCVVSLIIIPDTSIVDVS